MASLASLKSQMPEWVQRLCRWGRPPQAAETLAEAVAKAGQVAAIIATPGAKAIHDEAEAQERLLLEQFIAADDETTGTTSVKTWEQFTELRGFVRGFRARRTLGAAILQAGAAAELKLAAMSEQQSSRKAR